jgi:tetratricopeptide (TPR) repeat protein
MKVFINLFLFVSLLSMIGPAIAQERWEWPEKGENMQSLPEDFSGQRIRAVMTGFTRSLGVRCSHCHVGEEGAPLSTYDFPSDDNPKKNTAREMLAMLGDVNKHLDKIQPDDNPVNMWCHTCHRGVARPQSLAEALAESFEANGTEAAIERLRSLRERFYGKGAFDFSEENVNVIGYRIMEKQPDGAIALFRANLEFHPDSFNAADSLAESFMNAGRHEMAIAFYQKSLQLNPDNENAEKMIEKIKAGGDE